MSRSRSWQLERAYRKPFLTVLGKFEPQNVVGHRVDPKKALSYVATRILSHCVSKSIHTVNTAGHFSRRVREKNKYEKEMPYISRTWPVAPLRPIGTNFGLRVRLVDVINYAKFYRTRLRGLDSVRGRSLTIFIGLRCRR